MASDAAAAVDATAVVDARCPDIVIALILDCQDAST